MSAQSKKASAGTASASPSAGEQAELELRSHFAGRREGQRINAVFPVELVCLKRNFSARTVNLSCSGALLEVEQEETANGMDELISYCEEIGRMFAAGGTVDFGSGLTRTIRVVRITAGGLGKQMSPMVACRFTQRLSPEDFLRIGISPPSEEDVDADASEDSDESRIFTPLVDREQTHRKVPAIQELLRWAVDLQATDIHIKAGSPPRLRVNGSLNAVGEECLTDDEAKAMVRNFLSNEQWEEFEREGDLDTAFALEGIARFRINVLRARKRVAMIMRRIPEEVPNIASLGLAPICLKLAERRRGLVLVTGGSGSGKSTTLAAMVRHVNETRPCHIITLEDPIEYVHVESKAQITQREVGSDTKQFSTALKRVLRQDPDVVLIGEMRDLETIKLAVTAAETGHLVFATLHTTSAPQSIDRIVDVFPAAQQRQIRIQLASTLQAVITQVLVPRIEGSVAVGQEILIVTDAVRALMRDAKTPQLRNVMQTGAADGMQTLEDSLNRLVDDEIISRETALDFANSPGRIRGADGPERPATGVEDDAFGEPEPPVPEPEEAHTEDWGSRRSSRGTHWSER